MRLLGIDLPRARAAEGGIESTVVLLDSDGQLAGSARAGSLAAVAAEVERFAGDEPFLIGVGAPVVVPGRAARTRPVETQVRRRLGFRLPPGGRAALAAEPAGVACEALLAALAAAGRPCLPYPDRDRRRPCVGETHPALVVKALLWEASALGATTGQAGREDLFRAYEAPPYRAADLGARGGFARQAVALDLVLSALGRVRDYDLVPAREALAAATSGRDVERAAALLDALLVAGTARRYLEAPETCAFLGDHDSGYVILPANDLVRRLARAATPAPPDRLFPSASLGERLGPHAQLRPIALIELPGRPQCTEAEFRVSPRYEFDNLDEMLWWKHCRHVEGPLLPTEGLREIVVALGEAPGGGGSPLKLARSRHRTLSFRFEPPAAWRARVPTRDGRTYPFAVLRAVYETAARPV